MCSVSRALENMGVLCQSLATDIHASACQATLETLRNHEVSTSVEVIHCDLIGPLVDRMKNMIDLVAFNPPYVVTPDKEIDQGGISAAWAGGYKGRRVIDRVIPLLERVVSDNGIVYMIAIHDNDPHEIIEEMQRYSFKGSILAKQAADEELLYVLKFVKKSI
jgi:release factor glutamine methyltransferase